MEHGASNMPTREEQRLKRAACLIASQLPEDVGEALRVLDYARGIIRHLAPETADVIPLSFAPGQRYPAVVREDGREVLIDFPDIASPG